MTSKHTPKHSSDENSDSSSRTATVFRQLLAMLSELRESSMQQREAGAQQDKIDRIKRELEDEKEQLKTLRRRQQHKRELEQLRKQRQKPSQLEEKAADGMISLRNARGQIIGWVQATGADRVNILDSRGRLVAREVSQMTLDRSGRLVGRGKLGLVVLGRELPKNQR
jgi:hypothetical protein